MLPNAAVSLNSVNMQKLLLHISFPVKGEQGRLSLFITYHRIIVGIRKY